MGHKRIVVVAGMHRSGTSAVTRALQVLGVDLGENLMASTDGNNEKGFFEDLEVNRLNEELLQAVGHTWHSLEPMGERELAAADLDEYRERAEEILSRKLDLTSLFGLKDPRMARLLPFWQEVFSDLKADVGYVIACRHPASVARSLQKRDGFDLEKGYWLWLEHNLHCLRNTKGQARIVVDYDWLMDDPARQIGRMAACLDLKFDPDGPAFASYAQDFLHPELRHNYAPAKEPAQNGHAPGGQGFEERMPPGASELYDLLLDLAADKLEFHDEKYIQRLSRIEDKFAANRAALGYLRICDDRAMQAEERLAEAEHRMRELGQDVQDLSRHVSGLEEQVEELKQAVSGRDGQIADLNRAIEDILASRSWRITAPFRALGDYGRGMRNGFRLLPALVRRGGSLSATGRKALRVLRHEGLPGVRARIRQVRQAGLAGRDPFAVPDVSGYCHPRPRIVPRYIDPCAAPPAVGSLSIAVHVHFFYPEMLEEFAARLKAIPCPFDLFVSVPQKLETQTITDRFSSVLPQARDVVVEQVPNRGRDIGPLIVQFGARLAQYEVIAHFHTKKSPHCSTLSGWCSHILDILLGPQDQGETTAASILHMLQTWACVVFPEGQNRILQDKSGWAGNYELAAHLLRTYTDKDISEYPMVAFPQGGMFWARASCLREFLTLPLSFSDFPREPIPADGTLAHALERVLLIFADGHKGQKVRLHKGDSIPDYRFYESQGDFSSSQVHDDLKVLAYYLPQFHPIPENDEWHGKGFTEWTKVRKANPLFEGHYQQHIPHPDIGYYLLDTPDTLRMQAELMRKAGVHGQIFYHYWFSGKLILERPARMLLEHADIDMPFCFCWANENWTRRWDGNEQDVLLSQTYSEQDARDFIRYMRPFFEDSRYIRVDDRPVLFVYRPASMPDPQKYLAVWNQECRSWGLPGPYVVGVLTRGAKSPVPFGMDAGVERPLHDWTDGAVPDIRDQLFAYEPLRGSVLPYDQVADFYIAQTEDKDFTWFRSVIPMFDNTPRYGPEALLVHGSTPEKFQEWLERARDWSKDHLPEDRRFVVINAWNEWAESAHLEPDSRYGWAYLNAVGRALSGIFYGADINPGPVLSDNLNIRIQIGEPAAEVLENDSWLRKRFLRCLAQSTVFSSCQVSLDCGRIQTEVRSSLPEQARLLSKDKQPDFFLQVRKPALFAPQVIEKMLQTACHSPGSVVIPNAYDRCCPFPAQATKNGSVHSWDAFQAPLLLLPAGQEQEYKNFRMRPDASAFVSYPGGQEAEKLPRITTIIRVHQGTDFKVLERALFSLAAMEDCVVIPLVTAQGLNEDQMQDLESLLATYPAKTDDREDVPAGQESSPGVLPFVPNGPDEDMRCTMLNEGLKAVRNRYAGFLDHDDLLMSHAYSYLLQRMRTSGKAAAFGRVYSTAWDSRTGLIKERKKEFVHGRCFQDFWDVNPAPVHSFLLDVSRMDVENLEYHPQQCYLEDYYLTLQLLTPENTDWESLQEDVYIGDYMHDVSTFQSLACWDEQDREGIVASPEYRRCEQRIHELKRRLKGRKNEKDYHLSEI